MAPALPLFWRLLVLGVPVTLAAPILPRRLFIGGCCLAAVPCALECYSRAPPKWSLSDLPKLPNAGKEDVLVLVLHGAGGPDANVRRISNSLQGQNTKVVEYDWFRFVGDQLQAPYNAMRVGSHLADEILLGSHAWRSIHVVGISVGAFAADGLVKRFTERRSSTAAQVAHVKLTLLDPFTARGLPGLLRPSTAYGVEAFGRSADVAESVLNTDDPVPSTNLPLRHAVNFDVTASPERQQFVPLEGDSLHSWPAAWYGRHSRALDDAGDGVARGRVIAMR